MTDIEAQNSVNAGENLDSFGTGMDFFGGFGDFFATSAPESLQMQTNQTTTNTSETQQAVAASEAPREGIVPTVEEVPVIDQSFTEEVLATEEKTVIEPQAELPPIEEPAPPAEKPKKRKLTTVRKTKKAKEATVETENVVSKNTISIENARSQETPESVEMIYIPVDPSLDVRNIISSLNLIPDSTFMETQKEIQNKMNAIKIEKNIDKANITLMYDYIDELSDILRSNYAVVKTVYDNLVNREVGIIANVKKLNMVGPGTVADKERNAIKCLMAYKTDTMDEPVNLIQASWAANYEFNFLESAIEQLETKRRILKGMEDAII